jgi:Bacterial Ig-like domain (group 1)
MRKTGILSALLALALTACGGADDSFVGGTGSTGTNTTVGTLTLITSSPTVPSDGSVPAQISAFVRDSSNKFLKDVPVIFSASSGGLLITQGTTDANGLATATLSSAGDPSKRTITVTATAGTVTQTISVDVAGSTLTVQGPAALTLNQQGTYTVSLVNSGNHAVANQTVTVASQRNNALSATSVVTSSAGTATFKLTASSSGSDTITVTALGLTATQAVAVNSDSFTFTAPTANTEVALGVGQDVTVRWLVNNNPVIGQPVTFSTTRGAVSATTVNTDGSGYATVTVTASNAGGAVVSAAGGASTALVALEFVAINPSQIDVQPSVFSVATNQTSNITAVVRDAAGNLVKNKTVVFTLDDVSGGTLSVGSAVTDSQGRAQTVYTSSSSTSANQGVKITATVQGTAIAKQVALTVARREVFLSIGTGNTITEPNEAQYKSDYIVQVTDSNGNGVPNVPVSLRILSEVYYKGFRVPATSPATGWATIYTATGTGSVAGLMGQGCPDEDTLGPVQFQRNGILDGGIGGFEDYNGNGRLEAGNIAAVTPSNATTDANGFVLISVFFPQEHAYYLDVSLSASTSVQGTEYVRTSRFTLPGAASDFNDATKSPPGIVSPFGKATSCSNPN